MRNLKLDSIHLIFVSVNPPTKSINWIRMDYLVVDPRPFSSFRVVDDAAEEPDRQHVLRPSFLPGVAKPEPIVRLLNLPEPEMTIRQSHKYLSLMKRQNKLERLSLERLVL
jgi:hypothetical protein